MESKPASAPTRQSTLVVWVIEPVKSGRRALHERSLRTLRFLKETMSARIQPITVADPSSLGTPGELDAYLQKIGAEFVEKPRVLHCHSDSLQDISVRVAHFAEDTGAAMIVLSARGFAGPERWLTSAFDERVIAHSTVPVLLLQPDGAKSASPWESAEEKFLFATDFSDFSFKAFCTLVEEVRHGHVEILLYHVQPPFGRDLACRANVPEDEVENWFDGERRSLEERGAQWTKFAGERGVKTRLLFEGDRCDVAAAISRTSKREHVMIAAMGMRSESALSGYCGSVARDVLSSQDLPLWIAGPSLAEGPAASN